MTSIQLPEPLNQPVRQLADLVANAGGRAMLVGGSVRDALMGEESADVDIEVYGIAPRLLADLLQPHFRLDEVGRSFGVLKLHEWDIDVAVPRRETKSGPGHQGFDIDADPGLSPEQALRRRDFTINAIAYDLHSHELIDPYGGAQDLKRCRLRHTSEKFGEDPLRVLRGMQFVARFDLTPDSTTVELCRTMGLEGLAPERMFTEWAKLLTMGRTPSRGLQFLRDTEWVQFFPELAALIDCPQDPKWHPEGDVWIHTLHCLDHFAARRVGDDREDLVVGLAILCHDLGKPLTTFEADGRIRSPGHSQEGEAPTRSFLGRLTDERGLIEAVVTLVKAHLRPFELYRNESSDRAVRRLARDVGRIDRLVRVARSDAGGRPPLPADEDPAGDWLLAKARELELEASRPSPLVLGRHLIQLGFTPGKEFGPYLDRCFEAQLDGEFSTEAEGVEFLRRLVGADR